MWLYEEAREWASDNVVSAFEVKFIEPDPDIAVWCYLTVVWLLQQKRNIASEIGDQFAQPLLLKKVKDFPRDRIDKISNALEIAEATAWHYSANQMKDLDWYVLSKAIEMDRWRKRPGFLSEII